MRKRLGIRVGMAGVAALGITVLAGCQNDEGGGTHDKPSRSESGWDREAKPRTAYDTGGGTVPRFRVTLPEGVAVTDGGAPEDVRKDECYEPVWIASGDDRTSYFSWSAKPAGCEIDPSANEKPINGTHPTYRTTADIPPAVARTARKVRTPLGPALAFTQRYTVCTQRCDSFDEPFVVITLDKPADSGSPTLVFTSVHAELTLDELVDVVTKDVAPR
ncbi:hypothetical protein ACQUSR_15350 [Streptomyces sp. P1-3]|uniref:hypothetical protein n=1 Tax=Streptomyces sp. P1-3 TaxID=3421658 RepID=UPI003D3681B5